MLDTFGRTIDYLRISVTGACNFRCQYCAPNGTSPLTQAPLGINEIERIVRAAVNLGIRHFRLTGGEPLIRRDILDIVRTISTVPGVRDLALTTNAYRLPELAHPLREAGLNRINISLDSLRPERFAKIVGTDAYERVWRGIEMAERVGFDPLKLNIVTMRGINDDEANDFARLSIEHEWHVRFIELMPVGSSYAARDFFERHFISSGEIRARLGDLIPNPSPRGSGPAKTFRLPQARGTVGFIAPASEHFCAACNRIRVMANGEVLSCLFGQRNGQPNVVNADTSVSEIESILHHAILIKPEYHAFGEAFRITAQTMAEIGG